MLTLKTAAVVIGIGSILFMIAAFLPISRVFGLPSAKARLQLISTSGNAWVFSQSLFAAGSILTAIGVFLAAAALPARSSAAVYVAAALLLVGAIPWTWHVVLRARDPRAFVEGTLPAWHFIFYSFLTLAAFALSGYSLLRMGFPAWAAWLLMGGSLLFLILYLVLKDLPPFVYYLLGLILALALYFNG